MGNLGQFNKDIYKPLCGITERFSLGRISEETHLDKNEKLCYSYDVLNRVTARTVKNATTDAVISTETFTYDAAGNITGGSASTTFVYDTNNRLVTYNGNAVSYDLDGNMLSNGSMTCTYDLANRLLAAGVQIMANFPIDNPDMGLGKLMYKGWSQTDANALNSVFGAVDDACTYIYLLEN